MTARRVVVLLTAVLAVYLVAVAQRGWLLLRDGRPAFVLLGLGVLALPLVGAWLVAAELRFGRSTERLGRELAEQGALPADEPSRTRGGRVDRAAADAAFARRRAEVAASPDDWRGWFLLGLAYGDAGDRARGRRALRHAIRLHDATATRGR